MLKKENKNRRAVHSLKRWPPSQLHIAQSNVGKNTNFYSKMSARLFRNELLFQIGELEHIERKMNEMERAAKAKAPKKNARAERIDLEL